MLVKKYLKMSLIIVSRLGGGILKRNPSNSSYIFLLDMNLENITIGLHVFIISSMLARF